MRLFRRNTNPMPLEDEVYDSQRRAYCDPLVFWHHDNFTNIISRRMSLLLDPLVAPITTVWAILATAKTFKFYTSHGPEGQEFMQEWRQWWIENDLDELLKAIIPHFCMDGRVLLDLYFRDIDGLFDYDVFGSYECPPKYWKRDPNNNIIEYYVQFIPRPSTDVGTASGVKMVKKIFNNFRKPLQHYTRGDWNYGFGRSRVEPCWDPIIKMRHGSHADFFRRDIRMMIAVPDTWKKKRIEAFMNSYNGMLSGVNQAFVYKMEQSKDSSRTPLGLPAFGWEPLAKTPSPKPTSQSESGGQLLRDPEWARYLSAAQLSENYFIGNQSGAVTGSEVDLTRDFYAECQEFSLLEPVIKGILNWFVGAGLIPEPPKAFVIKYWKDWEHIELGQALMQQEMMMQQVQQSPNRENSMRYNSNLAMDLLYCIRLNRAMPMTPVMSSWIKGIGFKDGVLEMQTHEQPSDESYKYHITPDQAEGYYMEWAESGSKGGYWWDNIRDKLSPATKGKTTLPRIFGSEYGTKARQMREMKIAPTSEISATQPGETRAPFTTGPTSMGSFDNPSSFDVPDTAPHETILTPGYVSDPKSITGTKKVGPGRKRSPGKSKTRETIIPYNPTIFNEKFSVPSILKMAKKMNWNMSKSTAYNLLNLLKFNEESHKFRTNSWIMGNPMDFDVVLRYPDNPGGEKACSRSWKEISPHEGDLVVYDDLGHGGNYHKVGNYKYFWSEEEDRPIMIYEKETVFANIKRVLNQLGELDSMIAAKIESDLPPSISTEYYSGMIERDGTLYQVNFHDSNFEPKFERIAIVNAGNCDEPYCTFEQVEELN